MCVCSEKEAVEGGSGVGRTFLQLSAIVGLSRAKIWKPLGLRLLFFFMRFIDA